MVGGVHDRESCVAEGHAWQERQLLQQMVCILLECILALKTFDTFIYS